MLKNTMLSLFSRRSTTFVRTGFHNRQQATERMLPCSCLFLLSIGFLLLQPGAALASSGHHEETQGLLMVALILLCAKFAGEIAIQIKQPPVLGELCAGIVLGNLDLLGIHWFHDTVSMPSLVFLADLGVIILLFEVGLESTLNEMRKVASKSGIVAIIGVMMPMILGYITSYVFLDGPPSLHLFIGATLCATSVGITASVLKNLRVMNRHESRIILGAAVIDDILGLMVLAIVAGLAASGTIHMTKLASITGLATGFLVGSLLVGTYIMPRFFRAASTLKSPGVLSAIAISLCLLLSGISSLVGLAPIVGAFAAGLILDEVHVKPFGKRKSQDLIPLVTPIVALLAPIFFVRTGMMVDLKGIGPSSLTLAVVLSIVAIIGKVLSGYGVRNMDHLSIGIGMVPRGEVGLIFADVGREIVVHGKALISSSTYAAIVLMVMITTIISPPWLSYQLKRVIKKEKAKQI